MEENQVASWLSLLASSIHLQYKSKASEISKGDGKNWLKVKTPPPNGLFWQKNIKSWFDKFLSWASDDVDDDVDDGNDDCSHGNKWKSKFSSSHSLFQ